MYFALGKALSAAAFLALLAPAVMAAEKPAATVNQVIESVRGGLAQKKDDKQIAKDLSKLKLGERLELVVLDYMESEGAGPRAMEQLGELADASETLLPPTPPPAFPHPSLPSRDEMAAAIHHARAFAGNYAAQLPDFLCDEDITRYEDLRGRGVWSKRDTLDVRLSFEDRVERDKLVAMNGRATTASLVQVSGAVTSGEFGALMFQILDPASNGKFRWDHWTLLRTRPTQVYSFRIDAKDSRYRLAFGNTLADKQETQPAMEGFLYLDGDTKDVVRIVNHAADIDPSFPVRVASTRLDYATQDVGDKTFVLPLHAETRMDTALIRTRNVTHFKDYRKFSGESTITFGDPDEAAPPPKIKHQ
ncbi:MAG TPA: hypothetical protein VHW24_19445 [Bryobacteraceae bacterium]|jgi:hypothetical protein|nr:hypothetical protein [Bryobacteraceae bacterium]